MNKKYIKKAWKNLEEHPLLFLSELIGASILFLLILITLILIVPTNPEQNKNGLIYTIVFGYLAFNFSITAITISLSNNSSTNISQENKKQLMKIGLFNLISIIIFFFSMISLVINIFFESLIGGIFNEIFAILFDISILLFSFFLIKLFKISFKILIEVDKQ